MPFSLATVMAGITKWDSTVSALQGLSLATKCFRWSTKRPSFDQPIGFALQIEAVGAPISTWFQIHTLRNLNIGKTWLSMAFTATITHIYPPLPPEVTLPTCFILAHIILQHDQLNQQSHLNQILLAVILYLDVSSLKYSKNASKFSQLKLLF